MTTMQTAAPGIAGRVTRAGWLCLGGALLGAASGLMAFIPPAVGQDRFSYPFTSTGHVIAEMLFAVNHLLLLAGLAGQVGSRAYGSTSLGRTGTALAAVGLAALTLCEFGAIALAESAVPTRATDALGIGYGVASVLIGLGLVLAGIAILRAGVWTGWARHIVLGCGAAVFVIVLPGISGPMIAGRLALVVWMLLWAGIGLALVRGKR